MIDQFVSIQLKEYFPQVLTNIILAYQSEYPLFITVEDVTLSPHHNIVNAASPRERQYITIPDAARLMGKRYIILSTMSMGSLEIKLNASTSRFIPSPHQYVSIVSDGNIWIEI